MRSPVAIFQLKPILDDDPRFDGFVLCNEDFAPFLEDALQIFDCDGGMSRDWKPRRVKGTWTPLPVKGDAKPFNDYPCLNLTIPVFSHRAVDALGEMLTDNGQLLALDTEVGKYYGYVCQTKIDALNLLQSRLTQSSPDKQAFTINYFSFKPEKLVGATIFRIPEKSNCYFVTEHFKERVEQSKLNGFHFIPVWPLPEDSDWYMEEAYRRRARRGKKIPIVGEALMLRFVLKADQPSDAERKIAASLGQSLREQLKVRSLNDPYLGSIESEKYERGEFQILCSCPSTDDLESYLKPWFNQIEWTDGIVYVKRYGNPYTGRAKERSVALRKPNRSVVKPRWPIATAEKQRDQPNQSSMKRETHSDGELREEMPQQIKDSAIESLRVLGLDEQTDPQTIVAAIDQFVYDWQCGKRPPIPWDAEDIPYYLGSLWGEQLVRQFGWEWRLITFHEHGDSKAPGVVSPDRSMVIFPIHFLIGCIADSSVDATILLSFNMLKDGKLSDAAEGVYCNVMDQVFRIVPRIAGVNQN